MGEAFDRLTKRGRVNFTLCKNPVNPRVRVEEIRGRVALQGQHLVVTEFVVARPILGQVGIFQSAESDDLRDLVPFCFLELEVGTFLEILIHH